MRGFFIVTFSILFVLAMCVVAYADDSDSRLQELEKKQKELAKQIAELKREQAKMSKLASREELKKIMREISESEGYFGAVSDVETLLKERISFGGLVRFDYMDVDSDDDLSVYGLGAVEPGLHLGLNKVNLDLRVAFSDNIALITQAEFTPIDAWMEKAYVHIKDLGLNLGFELGLKAGLQDKFYKANEFTVVKTAHYPLLGKAFWREEVISADLCGSYKVTKDIKVNFIGSVLNGPGLGDAPAGMDGYYKYTRKAAVSVASNVDWMALDGIGEASYPMIHDRVYTGGDEDRMYYGIGVGAEITAMKDLKVNPMLWYTAGKLTDADRTYLQAITGYGAKDNQNKYRWGSRVVLTYKLSKDLEFFFTGEYMAAEDGDLSRSGFYLQPSIKYTTKELGFIKGIEPIFRWGKLNIGDIPAIDNDSRTWDRENILLGTILDLWKTNVKLKVEYVWLKEDNFTDTLDTAAGSEHVNNDEFLIQLELRF